MSETDLRFEDFASHRAAINGETIHYRVGGSGPPLLLLHGCPQTHIMWHRIAPALARAFTVVTPDLRGYGDSSKPRGAPDHANYAFRAMASDQIALMESLGFSRFSAVGHDRGARVLHRLALDHPDTLDRVCLLDILPTAFLYANSDRHFAKAYWEWSFFIQDWPFPEALLSADPEAFLRHELGALVDAGIIGDAEWSEYLRVLRNPEAMHGMCEDYRAGAGIDLIHDAADQDKRIASPLLVLWGDRNPIWQRFDMLEVWRQYADDIRGCALPSGHYLAEEVPLRVLDQLLPFLGA